MSVSLGYEMVLGQGNEFYIRLALCTGLIAEAQWGDYLNALTLLYTSNLVWLVGVQYVLESMG